MQNRVIPLSRRVTLALMFAACLPAAVLLPTAASADPTAPEVNTGHWGLQFGIAQNFSLTSFSGGIVGLKRQCAPGRFWRLGVGGSLEGGTGDDSFTREELLIGSSRSSGHLSGFSSELQYGLNGRGERPVRPYLATGPTATLRHVSESRTVSGDVAERRINSWALGVLTSLGAEWNPAAWVGIHAEYGFAVEYVHESQHSTETTSSGFTVRESATRTWRLSSRGVRFGLTAYL